MKKVILGLAAVLVLFWICSSLFSQMVSVKSFQDSEAGRLLKEIHDEVVLLGKYPGHEFFKREFFVGADDDDTNKDIHVAIVIHETEAEEKMIIQVTYMERTKSNPVVGIAKSVKSIKCSCKENQIDINQCGFSEKELKPILKDILRAIRNKKRLLKKVISRKIETEGLNSS